MEQRYTFLRKHAEKYGLREAVVLHTVIFFVLFNEKHNRNKREGKYWTFNSAKGWNPYFPFFGDQVISRLFLSLVKNNALIRSNKFNKIGYDRTFWYTLSPKLYGEVKRSEYWQSHLLKMKNGFIKNDTPIPDINTINIQPYI